jgi:phosphatidylserine/phosphatidylglycerophosphate/cardiolipin synthase-like enzyme
MKLLLSLFTVSLFVSCSHFSFDSGRNPSSTNYPYALFSPTKGKEAFEEIYKNVRTAEKYVHATIYSWSDGDIDKAFLEALKGGAQVKIVLHPPLSKKARTISKVKKLEEAGAEVKIAKHNMHEKYVIVDGKWMVNSSANMSGGAKTRYSEAFVYHHKDGGDAQESILKDFRHEFTVLWNSAKDMITNGEDNAEALTDYTKSEGSTVENIPSNNKNMVLYSSSMNFTISDYKTSSAAYKSGKYIKLSRRLNSNGEQTWYVRDVILKHINEAKKNIYVNLNHFNIRAVSDALIEAVKRGVDVRLAVDNQEYKSKPNNKEMTPQFYKDWKALPGNSKKEPPVRVKYYSHAPSPRHWRLNHHKYFVIDYTPSGKGTTLLAGSYNVSKNAEHKQFDNIVLYKGTQYKSLFQSFIDEFEYLWSLNRNEEDQPIAEIYNLFFTKKGPSSFPIHIGKGLSLTYNEIKKLRREINKVAKGIFSNLYRKRDCLYFDVEKQNYWGCPK